jgi:hypothetical protein
LGSGNEPLNDGLELIRVKEEVEGTHCVGMGRNSNSDERKKNKRLGLGAWKEGGGGRMRIFLTFSC